LPTQLTSVKHCRLAFNGGHTEALSKDIKISLSEQLDLSKSFK